LGTDAKKRNGLCRGKTVQLQSKGKGENKVEGEGGEKSKGDRGPKGGKKLNSRRGNQVTKARFFAKDRGRGGTR